MGPIPTKMLKTISCDRFFLKDAFHILELIFHFPNLIDFDSEII